jgi:predicted hotdog family 3-hydroxylacyl-ACP dehydratase
VATIEREQFAHLIPHAGRMCLVDAVDEWDTDHLQARSRSHRAEDHPLRRASTLAAIHALEYAAQAMAIHGALLAAERGEALPPGFLAGARDLHLHVDRLDDLGADLIIHVERRFNQGGNLIYGFRVEAGDAAVADGMATVVAR